MGKKYTSDLSGVINVYKEKGYTSHDAVAIVRKVTGAKAGHTGTLDPEAEGVLPVCLGKATKLSDYIMEGNKKYQAELVLGVTTDTQDATGVVLETKLVKADIDEIMNVISGFQGECLQTPPMYSAIKINGQKLYDLARAGKEVERKQRRIHIYDIAVIKVISPNKLWISVKCSKGTYIRTLCDDIGKKLGCGAHMGALVRTETGNFTIENSQKLNVIKQLALDGAVSQVIIPVEQILSGYKRVYVDEKANKLLYNGNKINTGYLKQLDPSDNGDVIVYNYQNQLIGIYQIVKESNAVFIKPKTMLV